MPFPKTLARFNKHVTNRFVLLFAGWIPPLATVIHHGRFSGRKYRTPILAFSTAPGFVFALTYGRDVDWVKNLFAAGNGVIEYGGSEFPLISFRFISLDEVNVVFPLPVRILFRLLSVEDCLLAEKQHERRARSEGSLIENPRYLRKEENKLARLQRQLSRKRKGSQNREKCRVKVAGLHEKIENCRNDFLHKASRQIVDTYETVYVEDLRISNMVHNHCLAKSISDASCGRFAGMNAYTAKGAGGRLIKVNPRNTSQQCNQCGEVVKKTLSTRLHECPACGLVMDRDRNGALNVLKRGREIGREPSELTPEGEFDTTQPLEVVQANSMNQEASLLVGR